MPRTIIEQRRTYEPASFFASYGAGRRDGRPGSLRRPGQSGRAGTCAAGNCAATGVTAPQTTAPVQPSAVPVILSTATPRIPPPTREPARTPVAEPTAAPSPTAQAAPDDWLGTVALVKTADRAEGVRRAVELLGVNPVRGRNVLLKPNFNSADPAPGSTHPDTLAP